MDPALAAEISDPSDGVPFRARPNHIHRTWARTFSSLPELYIQPRSLPEIEKITRLARVWRRRISTTGAGHSPSALTCTSGWMVNLDHFNRVLSLDADTGIAVMESGIRLRDLSRKLAESGLALPNLGSIDEQSIAGAIATGTHGSSLVHGLMSENITALKITLADGSTKSCSSTSNPPLFRAALLSLGALGIVSEVTFRAVPAFTLRWKQVVDADTKMLTAWPRDLWTQAEFVRVWWFPYTRRAVVWSASKTSEPCVDPAVGYYDGALGYYVYHNLLCLAQVIPRILPWVEWFVFGMQYGFRSGSTTTAVQPSGKAMLMNCLYSQFVNEWAIPLHRGPEALRRLSSWLNKLDPSDPDYVEHGIPFSAEGLYVHAPVEVRVSNRTHTRGIKPYLDPMERSGPTLYLNATLYRPYHRDPPCRERYYEAFEWLMRDMGGRPHWAKNFEAAGVDFVGRYGDDFEGWRKIRDEVDPEGMFIGPWLREKVLGGEKGLFALEEVDKGRKPDGHGGLRVFGVVE